MNINQIYIIILAILGVLLLLSYGYFMKTHNDPMKLWGKITGNLLIVYYISMFLAMLGFILLFLYIVKYDTLNKNLFIALLGIILFSMLWMPLSLKYLSHKNEILKYLILSVLFMVALFTFLVILILYNMKDNNIYKKLAMVGMLYFFIHVFFFDFITWSYNFF